MSSRSGSGSQLPARALLLSVFTVILSVFSILVSVLGGCGNDPLSVPCENCPLVTVEGNVSGGGGPVSALVRARQVRPSDAGSDAPETVVEAQTDSTGHYRLFLPPGLYLLRAVTVFGLDWYYSGPDSLGEEDRADTLRAVHDPIEADFSGGALRVQVDIPPALNGRDIYISVLEAAGPHTFFPGGTVKGAEGHAEILFPLLRPNMYIVNFFPRSGDRFWLPPTYGDAQAAVQIVTRGKTTLMRSAVDSPARVSGRVTESWQTMDTDRPVVGLDGAEPIQSQRVDSEGRFAFDQYVPGDVRLKVDIEGMVQWFGGTSYDDATPLHLTSGSVIDTIDIRESGLFCRIDGFGSDPERRVALKLVSGSSEWSFNTSYGRPVAIPNLRPGDYYLYLLPDTTRGLLPQWYDGKDSLQAATPIAIANPGEVVSIDAHLSRAIRSQADRRQEARER